MRGSRHDQLVHELGYGVTLGDEGRPQFVRPDGEPLLASPDRPAAPEDPPGAFTKQHAANDVWIDEETNFPEWDGETPDYHECIAVLQEQS